MTMIKHLFLCCLFVYTVQAGAQGVSISDTVKTPDGWKPAFSRELRHDAIVAEQNAIYKSDGTADKLFTPTTNEDINFLLTKALSKKVNALRYIIETDEKFDHRLKVNYLFGLESILKYYRQNWKSKGESRINVANLPLLLSAYEDCIAKDRKAESIEPIIGKLPYDVGTTLINAGIFLH